MVMSWWCHGDVIVMSWWCHDDVMMISWWCHGDVRSSWVTSEVFSMVFCKSMTDGHDRQTDKWTAKACYSQAKTHFLQLLISQDRNIIFKFNQSLKPFNHYVLVTSAIGTLQWVILCSPRLHKKLTFCICLYLRIETTFSRSSKAQN